MRRLSNARALGTIHASATVCPAFAPALSRPSKLTRGAAHQLLLLAGELGAGTEDGAHFCCVVGGFEWRMLKLEGDEELRQIKMRAACCVRCICCVQLRCGRGFVLAKRGTRGGRSSSVCAGAAAGWGSGCAWKPPLPRIAADARCAVPSAATVGPLPPPTTTTKTPARDYNHWWSRGKGQKKALADLD